MSYTRTFSKDIRISYSGTVSYPASKTGGVRTYSGTATETVHVNIEVDTLPFDESVVDCTHTVNGLTSSVTATEAAQIMAIDKNAQTLLKEYGRLSSVNLSRNSKTEVMASAVKDATNSMNIKLVVTLTKTGHTARLISKYRPDADILAITFDELTQRGLMLNWGVIPVTTDRPSNTDDMFDLAERIAVEQGLVESGDDIVIVAGVPLGEAVRTNTMRIRTVR